MKYNQPSHRSSLDSEICWVLEYASNYLRLSESEKSDLYNLLNENYLRSYQVFVDTIMGSNVSFLHPIQLEALRKACAERILYVNAQLADDQIRTICNPQVFLHSCIFVHRLLLSKDLVNGYVVQTLSFDLTNKLSIGSFVECVSKMMNIDQAKLKLFTALKNLSLNKEVDVTVCDSSCTEDSDADFDDVNYDSYLKNWKNSLYLINDKNSDQTSELASLPLYEGCEFFAISFTLHDDQAVELAKKYAESLKIDDARLFPLVPLPKKLCDEFVQLSKLTNFSSLKSTCYDSSSPNRDTRYVNKYHLDKSHNSSDADPNIEVSDASIEALPNISATHQRFTNKHELTEHGSATNRTYNKNKMFI